MRKNSAGVTLVELMVVLAILAIIVTIGYPMYTAQVQKARRVDARTALMLLAAAEDSHERTFGRFTESASTITGVTFADKDPTPGINSTFDDDVSRIAREFSDFYSFTIDVDKDGDTYTIEATPAGGQADDTACASFSVDQTGAKTATDTDLCW